MLTAKIENNEIITAGEIADGDEYTGICCKGHPFEVCVLTGSSVWGVCRNPDCPKSDGPDDYYRGVSYLEMDDFAEKLARQGADDGQPA